MTPSNNEKKGKDTPIVNPDDDTDKYADTKSDGSHGGKKSIPFRSWVYFRTGYAEYFVFVFGLLNTFTLTYYLAVENYPSLQAVFPSFGLYITIISTVGLPLLVLLGYVHIRRSSAYRSEVEISVETQPYMYRLPPGIHQEVLGPFFYEMLGVLKKADAGQKLTPEEIQTINDLDKKLDFLVGGGILKKPRDFGGI